MHTGKTAHMESMQTFEAEYPCFTSVLAHAIGLCTFKFVLKMNVCVKVLILSCIYGLSVTVRHHLNSEETVRTVQMIEDVFSQRRVARNLGVSPRLWDRYLETGNYSRRPGQGTPRATTDRQDRYLRNLAERNRHLTARGLRNDLQLATGVCVSNQTVRNRLHGDSLHDRRPATGPILTIAHRTDRRIFAKNHIG